MPKYLIERNMPGAGKMSSDELKGAFQTSNQVLSDMQKDGKNVQWVESYVTDDAIHCVYLAPDEEAVREHARTAGFPADSVQQIRATISPSTAGATYVETSCVGKADEYTVPVGLFTPSPLIGESWGGGEQAGQHGPHRMNRASCLNRAGTSIHLTPPSIPPQGEE